MSNDDLVIPGSGMVAKGARLRTAVFLLSQHYDKNEIFMQEFAVFLERGRDIFVCLDILFTWPSGPSPLTLSWTDLPQWVQAILLLDNWRLWNPKFVFQVESGDKELVAYWEALNEVVAGAEELAEKWGLRSDWGPGLILQCATQSVKRKSPQFLPLQDTGGTVGSRIHDLSFLEPYVPEGFPESVVADTNLVIFVDRFDPLSETWSVFQKRALEKLRLQREEIYSHMELGGWERIGSLNQLRSHVYWLYLAISPDPGKKRPLTFYEIADRVSEEEAREYSNSAISGAVGGERAWQPS